MKIECPNCKLTGRPVLDRDALAERQTETIHNAAFGLRKDIIGLHRYATVDGAPEIVHLDLPAGPIERHLGDAGGDQPHGQL